MGHLTARALIDNVDTKIAQQYFVAPPNQHIFRLDIPVNDFFMMGILQSIGYLLQIREDNGRSDNGVSRMALSQRAIGGIVQHQEGSILQHVKIKDADNMRMP